MKYSKNDKIKLVKTMLDMIGETSKREGLVKTPERIVKMWDEIFKGYDNQQKPKIAIFNNGRDGIVYEQMIFDEGKYYSICEHHMLPFFGNYFFAYIPHKNGKIIGLSKIAKVVDYFSARLQIQERLVQQIVNFLWDNLNFDGKKPIGMGLVMTGNHMCKSMRGVKKEGAMSCICLKGLMKTDETTKMEFLNWTNAIKK